MNPLLPAAYLSSVALLWATPSIAQNATPAEQEAPTGASAETEEAVDTSGEIVVVAERIPGQLDVPQKAIEVLDEKAITSYGANSVSDLLASLAPQTGSGRGRGGGGPPITLINGQRITSFREMRDMPTEAIRRMEILPEEVALRFGYPPNARVVNMILKDSFAQRTVDIEYGGPDRGGSTTAEQELSLFSVNKGSRLNLTAARERTTPLTEAERGVIQATGSLSSVPGDPDPAGARTLISDRTNTSLNATWTKGLGKGGLGGSITLNGTISRANTNSLQGLNSVTLIAPGGASALRTFGDPLERSNQTVSYQGGAGFNKPFGEWLLSATVDASRTESDTRLERRAGTATLTAAAAAGTLPITGPIPPQASLGFDRAWTASNSVASLVTVIGRPLRLPGGEVTSTIKGGFAHTAITSEDSRTALGRFSLKRDDASVGVNIGIPIASRREGFLEAIGNLSLNFSAGYNHLSDFGSLSDWSAGLNWGPTEKLNLQASYIVNQRAPSLAELGNPVVQSFNVPVFDFERAETVLVTVTTGGNPGLVKGTDRDLKFGANWQLPFVKNTMIMAEYFRNNSDNVTASFPVLTQAIEAAFPGRVTRINGKLTAIDRRPVNFFNEQASRLRWGVNVNGPIGKAPAGAAAGGPGGMGRPQGGPGGRMGGGGRGGPPMMGPMNANGVGRWNLALFHTVQFRNRVTVAAGGPVLDLLNGDALSGGGVARHTLELDGGFFYRGVGLRLNGNYTAPTRIDGTTDLRFGSLTKVNMRLFVNMDVAKWLAKDSKVLKGVRVAMVVNNLFDSRQKVTDSSGTVPIGYQPDLLDPTGRFIGLDISKRF
ncbi:TonB-dependent receptor [Novosphingobium sp. TH158]|uniref:TonB-dependent receptor n=1 Tax=Novosphingobium sp. TH158 TaxID=2067455 RepID=UPI000C7A08CE|nr:TonB-dependent receptor [Novosphingobium sp. TH158]PLK26047.1 TonB-dependent receptor [Novosphingobium sp. TH158]